MTEHAERGRQIDRNLSQVKNTSDTRLEDPCNKKYIDYRPQKCIHPELLAGRGRGLYLEEVAGGTSTEELLLTPTPTSGELPKSQTSAHNRHCLTEQVPAPKPGCCRPYKVFYLLVMQAEAHCRIAYWGTNWGSKLLEAEATTTPSDYTQSTTGRGPPR